jgi:hypothetical protein
MAANFITVELDHTDFGKGYIGFADTPEEAAALLRTFEDAKALQLLQCVDCLCLGGTTEIQEDPYDAEINDDRSERPLCDACFEKNLWAI